MIRWWELARDLAGTGDFLFGALRDPLGLEPRLVALGSVVESYDRIANSDPVISDEAHQRLIEAMVATIDNPKIAKHYTRLRHANEHIQRDRFRRGLDLDRVELYEPTG